MAPTAEALFRLSLPCDAILTESFPFLVEFLQISKSGYEVTCDYPELAYSSTFLFAHPGYVSNLHRGDPSFAD
jgi:hypothetical protein